MDLIEVVLSGVLAFGQPMSNAPQQTVKHAGLQVLHDDGAASLRLMEASRETVAADGATDTVVRYRDEAYPFEVPRHVRRWGDCGIVETWDEIRLSELPSGKRLVFSVTPRNCFGRTGQPIRTKPILVCTL